MESPEVQTDNKNVSFSGEDLVALQEFLYECRYTGRSGPDHFRLVDMHNAVRETLGMKPVPVHPGFQEGYDAYTAEHSVQAQS